MHTPDSGGMKKFHVVAYYSKVRASAPFGGERGDVSGFAVLTTTAAE